MKSTKYNKALQAALKLLSLGPSRIAEPIEWVTAVYDLSEYKKEHEDATETAARIVKEHLVKLRKDVQALVKDSSHAVINDGLASGTFVTISPKVFNRVKDTLSKIPKS